MMPRPLLNRFALPLLLLLAVPLAHAAGSAPERVRIHGSNVMGHSLVPALAEAWLAESGYSGRQRRRNGPVLEIHAKRDDEAVLVEIEARGSDSAFADLVSGAAEVGMSARPPSAKEVDDAWLIGRLRSPDQEFVVAVDGLMLVVHPDNPLRALSVQQLREVFGGRIRDWSALGGKPGAIRLHGRAVGSGGHELLSQLLLDGAPQSPGVQAHADAGQVIAAVAADPAGIGYLPLGVESAGVQALAVSAGGPALAPTRLNALAEDYPLTRRLSLYGSQLMSALGRSFATFCLSPAGQAVVRREGMLALAPTPEEADPNPAAPEEYARMLIGAQRLPLNLRFGGEYTVLESRAVQDLERIIAFMREPANRGRELMLMGFVAPDPGGAARALFYSHDRVDFVADLLGEAGVPVTRRRGFGSAAPLAAGQGPGSEFRNERIELWVR